MATVTKLLLHKTNDLSTYNSTDQWALYTNPSGNFETTQTSMYAEVIGLASTTNYGGASLGNQSAHRYLTAIAMDFGGSESAIGAYQSSAISNSYNAFGFNDPSATFNPTTGNANFSSIQSALEDDGQYFVSSQNGSNFLYTLHIDKNNLGNSSGSSSTSLTSWAYSSQSSTDPNILIDWATSPSANFEYSAADTTDWKTDIKAKITAKSLNINDLLADYILESHNVERMKSDSNYMNNFIEYINKKINTQ